MSSGDENEIMPMTSAAPPGSDNDHDASFNNLIDMPTQSKRKKLINCLKKSRFWKCVYLVLFISILGIAVTYFNMHDPCESTSNNIKGPEGLSGSSPHISDSHCILHTPKKYMDELPDNIDSHCTPVRHETGSPIGMAECGQGTRMFIFHKCLCDANSQCGLCDNTTQCDRRFDEYSKINCTKCRDRDHCPCQNNGECNECKKTVEKVICTCPNGTTGTYCTKISRRLCHRTKNPEDTLGLLGCNVTNNKLCMAMEYSTSVLVCQLTEFLKQYPNCSAMAGNGRTEFQKTEEVNTKEKYMLVPILIISAFGACVVIINLLTGCRKQKNTTVKI